MVANRLPPPEPLPGGAASKTWDIFVESAGAAVRLIWAPDNFPKRSDAFHPDAVTGVRMDMKKLSSYSFEESGRGLFRVEVTE